MATKGASTVCATTLPTYIPYTDTDTPHVVLLHTFIHTNVFLNHVCLLLTFVLQNHPGIILEICPFNARHRVPPSEIRHHKANCVDRVLIEQDMMIGEGVNVVCKCLLPVFYIKKYTLLIYIRSIHTTTQYVFLN